MIHADAVYEDGVFRPAGKIDLANHQPVRLTIEVCDQPQPSHEEWIDKTRRFREQMRAKYGNFSDSTEIIAEDRRREV